MLSRLIPVTSKTIRHIKAQHCARFVGSQSWAYDRLVELGRVEVSASTERPLTLVTDELLKTPPPKVVALVDEILKLNVLEVHALYKVMEQVLAFDESLMYGARGGNSSPSVGISSSTAPATEKVEEKTSFDVKIGAVDAKAKIKVIKEVRAITGLGLKEAKDLVEKAPVTIKEGLKKEDAEQILKVLTEAGAEASLI